MVGLSRLNTKATTPSANIVDYLDTRWACVVGKDKFKGNRHCRGK